MKKRSLLVFMLLLCFIWSLTGCSFQKTDFWYLNREYDTDVTFDSFADIANQTYSDTCDIGSGDVEGAKTLIIRNRSDASKFAIIREYASREDAAAAYEEKWDGIFQYESEEAFVRVSNCILESNGEIIRTLLQKAEIPVHEPSRIAGSPFAKRLSKSELDIEQIIEKLEEQGYRSSAERDTAIHLLSPDGTLMWEIYFWNDTSAAEQRFMASMYAREFGAQGFCIYYNREYMVVSPSSSWLDLMKICN